MKKMNFLIIFTLSLSQFLVHAQEVDVAKIIQEALNTCQSSCVKADSKECTDCHADALAKAEEKNGIEIKAHQKGTEYDYKTKNVGDLGDVLVAQTGSDTVTLNPGDACHTTCLKGKGKRCTACIKKNYGSVKYQNKCTADKTEEECIGKDKKNSIIVEKYSEECKECNQLEKDKISNREFRISKREAKYADSQHLRDNEFDEIESKRNADYANRADRRMNRTDRSVAKQSGKTGLGAQAFWGAAVPALAGAAGGVLSTWMEGKMQNKAIDTCVNGFNTAYGSHDVVRDATGAITSDTATGYHATHLTDQAYAATNALTPPSYATAPSMNCNGYASSRYTGMPLYGNQGYGNQGNFLGGLFGNQGYGNTGINGNMNWSLPNIQFGINNGGSSYGQNGNMAWDNSGYNQQQQWNSPNTNIGGSGFQF